MPTYSRPGVFIEEYLRPLSDLSVDPAESAAAFVGKTSGGPVGPLLVTSWTQYQALFGNISTNNEDLAYAVYSFFENGGRGAYIVRAYNADATAADLTLTDGAGAPVEVLDVTASAPGVWASDPNSSARTFVTVRAGTSGSNRFDLLVEVGTGSYLAAQEQWVDLSMDPNDPRYVVDVVNSPVVGSKYVTVALATGYTYTPATPVIPVAVVKAPLTGGSDGTGTPDLVAATDRLDSVDRNLVVNVPGASETEVASVVSWAETSGRHFVVADVPKPTSGSETETSSVTAMTDFADALPNSSHVAVYGPWIWVTDPGSRAGALRLTAPGGAVVGQFLRTDATRGVHKAPAGVQTSLSAAVAPFKNYTNVQQDTLAGSAVNLIRTIPGAGVAIMGARTQSNGYPDRYVPVRRLLVHLKTALADRSRFAVFEPNDADLWATIEEVLGSYLQTMYDLGAFKGDSPEQGFYVRCDETINSPATVDAGLVNIEVGVALKSPAEFIVIRLGQQEAGAVASDSLEGI